MPNAYLSRKNELWIGNDTRVVDLSEDSGGHSISQTTNVSVRQPLGTTITKRQKLVTERTFSMDGIFYSSDTDAARPILTSGAKSLVGIINRNTDPIEVDLSQQVWSSVGITGPTDDLLNLNIEGSPTDSWMRGYLLYSFDNITIAGLIALDDVADVKLRADKPVYLLTCLKLTGHTATAAIGIGVTDPTDGDARTRHDIDLDDANSMLLTSVTIDDVDALTNSSLTTVDIAPSTHTLGFTHATGFIALLQPIDNL